MSPQDLADAISHREWNMVQWQRIRMLLVLVVAPLAVVLMSGFQRWGSVPHWILDLLQLLLGVISFAALVALLVLLASLSFRRSGEALPGARLSPGHPLLPLPPEPSSPAERAWRQEKAAPPRADEPW